jgi:hypothetical protein
MTSYTHQSFPVKEEIVAKTPLTFPVSGVPGGWQDEWSGPDPAVTARQQFATWEAAQVERLERLRQDGTNRGVAGTTPSGDYHRSMRSDALA